MFTILAPLEPQLVLLAAVPEGLGISVWLRQRLVIWHVQLQPPQYGARVALECSSIVTAQDYLRLSGMGFEAKLPLPAAVHYLHSPFCQRGEAHEIYLGEKSSGAVDRHPPAWGNRPIFEPVPSLPGLKEAVILQS